MQGIRPGRLARAGGLDVRLRQLSLGCGRLRARPGGQSPTESPTVPQSTAGSDCGTQHRSLPAPGPADPSVLSGQFEIAKYSFNRGKAHVSGKVRFPPWFPPITQSWSGRERPFTCGTADVPRAVHCALCRPSTSTPQSEGGHPSDASNDAFAFARRPRCGLRQRTATG